MTRHERYTEDRQHFLDYLEARKCPTSEKDAKLDYYNRQYSLEALCDLTDALCEIAKTLEGIKSEISQIRRQMPR